MIYKFYRPSQNELQMTERHSCSKILFSSKKKIKELYPNGGFEVIGEIGNFAKKYLDQDVIITDKNKFIPIFPRGSAKRPFEWIAGYAALEENVYVVVLKSIISF